jgi:hypothetical protein
MRQRYVQSENELARLGSDHLDNVYDICVHSDLIPVSYVRSLSLHAALLQNKASSSLFRRKCIIIVVQRRFLVVYSLMKAQLVCYSDMILAHATI